MTRLASAAARSWLAATLSGLALLAAGCGAASSAPQAAGPASSPPASAASAGARAPASGSPAPSASCQAGTAGASAAVYTAPGSATTVPPLEAVQFVSASQGWAAGAGLVLATSDGGRTWTTQYTGTAKLDQVDFTDAEHGWAVGTNALLRTTDGGATWTALAEPQCQNIESVHFVTQSLGYAVAGGAQVWLSGGVPAAVGGGELLRTTDGGSHWVRVAGAPAQAQTACFSGPNDGFVGTPGKVWHTTDGGASWSLAFTEPPESSGVHPPAPDTTVLECAGGNAAWALFLGYGAALGHAPYLAYATRDARNWRAVFEESYIESGARPEVHAPNGPGSYPGPFSAISPGVAAFVGYTPPLGYGAAPLEMASSGGATLTQEGNVGGVSVPEATAFTSPSQGWVVGQTLPSGDFVIMATADAGHTWTRQYQAR